MDRLAFGVAVAIVVTIFNVIFLGLSLILSFIFKLLKMLFTVFIWATKFPGTRFAN